jgi:hypothetical protein
LYFSNSPDGSDHDLYKKMPCQIGYAAPYGKNFVPLYEKSFVLLNGALINPYLFPIDFATLRDCPDDYFERELEKVPLAILLPAPDDFHPRYEWSFQASMSMALAAIIFARVRR